jgi:hypothetical protein
MAAGDGTAHFLVELVRRAQRAISSPERHAGILHMLGHAFDRTAFRDGNTQRR